MTGGSCLRIGSSARAKGLADRTSGPYPTQGLPIIAHASRPPASSPRSATRATYPFQLRQPLRPSRGDRRRLTATSRALNNNICGRRADPSDSEASLVVKGLFGGVRAREVGPLAGWSGLVVVSMYGSGK